MQKINAKMSARKQYVSVYQKAETIIIIAPIINRIEIGIENNPEKEAIIFPIIEKYKKQ